MNKYSSTEADIVVQSQLYCFEQSLSSTPEYIRNIGDFLPGVVLINDLERMENTYMNANGCNFLCKSPEELKSMGPEYFTDEIFCRQEMRWINQYFKGFVERNDAKEVTGFYQKVRPDQNKDWSHFYLSGKLLESDQASCIYLAVPANPSNYLIHKIQQSLGTEAIPVTQFQRFSTLSKREKEITGLITKGLTGSEISEILFLSKHTIDTHRKNIYKKLGTKKLSDLIRIADRFGL
jgi:DNA-binding CsgD family transcriptional regulator